MSQYKLTEKEFNKGLEQQEKCVLSLKNGISDATTIYNLRGDMTELNNAVVATDILNNNLIKDNENLFIRNADLELKAAAYNTEINRLLPYEKRSKKNGWIAIGLGVLSGGLGALYIKERH